MVMAMIACGCDEHGSTPHDAPIDSVGDASASGRACALAMQNDPTVVGSPSLDCPSRLCAHIAGFTPDQCSAFCERPEDCFGGPESSCSAGFQCTAIVMVGPFACRKMCVCNDRAPVTSCPQAVGPLPFR